MACTRRRAAWILGFFVVAVIPLIPDRQMPVERASELDIELVRSAQCEYRGITATFDELTRAYALSAFTDAELEDWTSRPNPHHPETEALIRCRFRVAGPRSDAPAARTAVTAQHRSAVDGRLDVTWRLGSLSSVQVQPHTPLAQDALDVFRMTVDRLLDRMVYLNSEAELLDAPHGVALGRLDAGTLLLREQRDGTWTLVRVPSDTTAGWVPDEVLRSVSAAAGN